MTEKDIFKQLQAIQEKALARYSNFRVAAILESASGSSYTGINIESSSYGLTICAERVALFKALSEGERHFRRIFLLCDGEKPCSPCGACRQVLMDYAPSVEVIIFNQKGHSQRFKLTALLPNAFGSDHLKD